MPVDVCFVFFLSCARLPEYFCPEDVTVGPFNNQAAQAALRSYYCVFMHASSIPRRYCYLELKIDGFHYRGISTAAE